MQMLNSCKKKIVSTQVDAKVGADEAKRCKFCFLGSGMEWECKKNRMHLPSSTKKTPSVKRDRRKTTMTTTMWPRSSVVDPFVVSLNQLQILLLLMSLEAGKRQETTDFEICYYCCCYILLVSLVLATKRGGASETEGWGGREKGVTLTLVTRRAVRKGSTWSIAALVSLCREKKEITRRKTKKNNESFFWGGVTWRVDTDAVLYLKTRISS